MQATVTDQYMVYSFLFYIVQLTMANQAYYCLKSHIKESFTYFKDKFLGQVSILMTTAVKVLIPESPDQKNIIMQ